MTRPDQPSPVDRVRAVDRAALAAAYERGESLRRCAARFGISHPVVARLLREHGVTIRPFRPYKSRAGPAALAAAYAAGKTLVECGQEAGISGPTVARVLREHGVVLRRACRRPAHDISVLLAPRRGLPPCRRRGRRAWFLPFSLQGPGPPRELTHA